MSKIRSATRLALVIGFACATIVWIATGIGLISNPKKLELSKRVDMTKTIAVNVTTYAENPRGIRLEKILDRTVKVDEDLISIGIFQTGRGYLHTSGPHEATWNANSKDRSGKQISVEINSGGKKWADLELAFRPLNASAPLMGYPYGLIAFIAAATSLLAWVVLANTLRYLNPSKVVPNRVRSALDTLAEGLVLVDNSGEIAHANQAFQAITEMSDSECLGMRLDNFGWTRSDDAADLEMPWVTCAKSQNRICGEIVQLQHPNAPVRKFVVNATPIIDASDNIKGTLVSFDDVTALENKNAELAKMIGSLRISRDEIARQNEQLSFLASYDPLTMCMNRRAFFGRFEDVWNDESVTQLNLMMLDVDHFKSVNDNHGHSVGDEVLKAVGSILRDKLSEVGLVCRFGGEEFVVLVGSASVEQCVELAEGLRVTIENTEICGINITASIGVSSKEFKPMDPQHMLDQADECLYNAKRSGRNRVIRYDQQVAIDEADDKASKAEIAPKEAEISYSAVTGLLSALSFRCPSTAEHSIRVADLCVAVGESLMSKRELYRLEIAALLHDIGKIGVPDAVLHKPGPLTKEEWVIMQKHDDIGVEIVRSAFASEIVASAIESHHYSFSVRNKTANQELLNQSISLIARIITVCDAYDAMTNDRVYRKALSIEDSLAEIKKHTPSQFDPMVVDILVNYVESGLHHPRKPSADGSATKPNSRTATAIGQHIEELYEAIHAQDVDRLKSVVTDLKQDASPTGEVSNAADRLDSMIQEEDNLEKVLQLANEVVDICRSSRSTFVETAETIVGSTLTNGAN